MKGFLLTGRAVRKCCFLVGQLEQIRNKRGSIFLFFSLTLAPWRPSGQTWSEAVPCLAKLVVKFCLGHCAVVPWVSSDGQLKTL